MLNKLQPSVAKPRYPDIGKPDTLFSKLVHQFSNIACELGKKIIGFYWAGDLDDKDRCAAGEQKYESKKAVNKIHKNRTKSVRCSVSPGLFLIHLNDVIIFHFQRLWALFVINATPIEQESQCVYWNPHPFSVGLFQFPHQR